MAKAKSTRILQTLCALKGVTSTSSKKAILRSLSGDSIAREVLHLAVDPYITFGISARGIPRITNAEEGDAVVASRWQDISQGLMEMRRRRLTGGAARTRLESWMALDYLDALVSRIINKDPDCGVGPAIINSVFPGLIREFVVMLASSDVNAIKYPAWAEPKKDGVRVLAFLDDSNVKLYSRSGREYGNFPNIGRQLAELTKLYPWISERPTILDGEICGKEFDDVATVVHRKRGKKDGALKFIVFDALLQKEFSYQDETPSLRDRRDFLALVDCAVKEFSKTHQSSIEVISGRLVHNPSELWEYHDEIVNAGDEGLVVKNLDASYDYGRSDNWVKVKKMHTYDGKVVSVVPHSKQPGKMGSIVLDVNGVHVNVGSGFLAEERVRYWRSRSKLVGRWVEFKAQSKTKDGSFRFPVFVRFRERKD